MPRKDENGRGLQAVLSYLLDRAVPATEIYGALGIARNTYHGRSEEDTFPNAEECRLVAEHFGINPLQLLVTFGLISQVQLEGFFRSPLATRSTSTATTLAPRVKLSDLRRRDDVPAP